MSQRGLGNAFARVRGRYQRGAAAVFFKRPVRIESPRPIISFTFDDFPSSALYCGGRILTRFGVGGTYYTSLGLAEKDEATGRMFAASDLAVLLQEGHELGCHTYAHCHSWNTEPTLFEQSILDNRHALQALIPGAAFKTFSYPISPPRPRTKARVARQFPCSRGGGQRYNAGTVDLNQLFSFFLEKSRDDIEAVKDVIDATAEHRGWLILTTHDVASTPTPYGCTPAFFEEVVRYAVESGARILPVSQALDALRLTTVQP